MRRALLIGSQTGGLSGVLPDVELMAATLADLAFTVTTAVGPDASSAGIREHYDALIASTAPGDAAVVYYSGHGGRVARDGGWDHFIVPTDEDRDDGQGYVLAEELSADQRRLAARSVNVTTILDCCHSARMSRRPDAVVRGRALSVPLLGAAARAQAAREVAPGPPGQDANPDAVRLVACGSQQSAWESPDPELGVHGALTAALVRVLRGPDVDTLTWRDVLSLIRPPIRDEHSAQRPEVEGPADRLLFREERRDGVGVLPLVVRGGVLVIEHADVFGVGPGDRYAVVAPGRPLADAIGEATVVRVAAGAAVLEPESGTLDPPPGSAAWPRAVALGRRRVAVTGDAGPTRDGVLAGVEASARLAVAEPSPPSFAQVRVDGPTLQITDTTGAALYDAPRRDLRAVVMDLETLARADHLRDVPSSPLGHLLDDVEVSLLRIPGEALVGPGDPVHVGGRLLVRLHNRGRAKRYVAVFDLGIAGAVTLLSVSEPDGITLVPDERYDLGADWAAEPGIVMDWVDGIATDAPRPETFLVIVAEDPVDGLRALGQQGVRRGDGEPSLLDRLLDEVAAGRRDARPPSRGTEHRVHRLDIVLHPAPR